MAAPVFVLSVDLQTKTATFQTGMADAARSAKEAFKGIKQDSAEMADGVEDASARTNYSMTEARHGVMMLGEEFGVHLPRGLTTFIASLGPVGAAMEAAFPFLAIILGATLLIEHLVKVGEAAEKAAEAGRTLGDDLDKGIIKAKEGIINAEIEIRKLAGEPAWDLIAEKIKLQDAEVGIENVQRLDKALQDLLKANGATSNWNPFNWLDHSDDLQAKAKTLKESMSGKSQTEQTGVLTDVLTMQSKILEQMKGQTDVSAAQLKNQQAYVDFLKKETELIQQQADTAVGADQAKQGKDRESRIKEAEAEQAKLYETQQRGLERRRKAEEEYSKKVVEAAKKAGEEKEKEADEELKATDAVSKEMLDQLKERARIGEQLGKEEAEHTKKMAALEQQETAASTKEMVKLHRSRSEEVLAAQIAGENADYEAQMQAYKIELGALDQFSKEFQVKKKQIDDREQELTKAHENKITQIRMQAEEERNSRILSAAHRADAEMASGLSKVIEGQESFGKMITSLGQQVATGMLENAMKSIMANDMTKTSDAAAAGRKGWLMGQKFPFPVDLVMAPALAAAAFSAVMAFNEGGIVPGFGDRDTVPAMLTPGEGVIPRKVMEGLVKAGEHQQPESQPGHARGGGDSRSGAPSTVIHVHAKDADSFMRSHSQILSKQQHAQNLAHKRNR